MENVFPKTDRFNAPRLRSLNKYKCIKQRNVLFQKKKFAEKNPENIIHKMSF